MKILFFFLMALIFHGETIKQHPRCRGPASNYACEYFYDLVDEEVPEAILDFLKRYSVTPPPRDFNAKSLFTLYGYFDISIPGVDFNKNFVANVFAYTDKQHQEVVGYRDTQCKDKKPGDYEHNKYSVAELTSTKGANFVDYEDYFNLMKFNVKALNYDPEIGGEFVLTYDLLQPKLLNIFATTTMQVGKLHFRVEKIDNKFVTYYIDADLKEHKFTGIYLQAIKDKPLDGIENLILFDGSKHVVTIPAAEKVKANRGLKL
ncbi:MAG: hypothetical protein JNM93_13345 [Bacteriovoracaceae bacterium]|nr:hypothetical protein [Bacteriovoracaceae bacterium]